MTSTVAARNKAADALTPTTISIHSGDPGPSGTANIIGTAQPCSYGAAVAGVRTITAEVPFSVPAGTTVTHTVVIDADSDAIDISPLATPETYSNAGTHVIGSGTTITVS